MPKRQCYWLHESQLDPCHPDRFRVLLVTESKSGFQYMGGGFGTNYPNIAPWYWDHVTCTAKNRQQFGLSQKEADKIILSTMFRKLRQDVREFCEAHSDLCGVDPANE